MTRKVTITLDEELLAFLDGQVAGLEGVSRSAFVNSLLVRERGRILQRELEDAYRRDAADSAYREEVLAWDSLAGDGIA